MSAPFISELRTALRRAQLMHHVEAHALFGSDFEKCPNVHCQETARLLRDTAPVETGNPAEASDQAQ